MKTIITEKENQVINLQSTIGSLKTQTDRIYNQIIRFVGDAIIVNADEDLFGVLYAKLAKVTKEIQDKLEKKDKLIERLQARHDQANQQALFWKLAEKMGKTYESGDILNAEI